MTHKLHFNWSHDSETILYCISLFLNEQESYTTQSTSSLKQQASAKPDRTRNKGGYRKMGFATTTPTPYRWSSWFPSNAKENQITLWESDS